MKKTNRRTFVKQTSSALAGISVASALDPSRVLGANERMNVATIGVRNMGWSDTSGFLQTGRANIVAMCDVDSQLLGSKIEEAGKQQKSNPKAYSDFRKLLENDEVDAVIVATPDHWHGIIAVTACQAGKDVYVEKPCAHNIHECRAIAEAARKYKRIVQHGTQQRSGKHFLEAKTYVQSGRLGRIAMARTWGILGRGGIGKAPVGVPPAHIDYNAWLGPAPKKPYTENRCHYNWRFMWDYGTGDMGNWGVHWLDIAVWALELGWPTAVSSSGGQFLYDDDKETPDTQMALYEYPDLTLVWELRMWDKHGIEGRGTGTAFYGEKETLIVNRSGYEVFAKDGERLKSVKPSNNMDLDHKHNFIDSVQSRQPPVADIAEGQIGAGVAVLGNVAFLANEKIRYNPETNRLARPEMNHLLTREYRKGWEFPTV